MPITVPVTWGDVQKTVLALGVLVSACHTELSIDDSGRLAEVLMRPGEAVRAGDVLACPDTKL